MLPPDGPQLAVVPAAAEARMTQTPSSGSTGARQSAKYHPGARGGTDTTRMQQGRYAAIAWVISRHVSQGCYYFQALSSESPPPPLPPKNPGGRRSDIIDDYEEEEEDDNVEAVPVKVKKSQTRNKAMSKLFLFLTLFVPSFFPTQAKPGEERQR